MSKSNLYGARDRRLPVPGTDWIPARAAYDEMFGKIDVVLPNRATDKESRWYLEQQSYDRAVRRMSDKEKMKIDQLAAELEKKLGKGSGRGTALQILARLGVYFSLNNYGGR